jgi:hypothetical protein
MTGLPCSAVTLPPALAWTIAVVAGVLALVALAFVLPGIWWVASWSVVAVGVVALGAILSVGWAKFTTAFRRRR